MTCTLNDALIPSVVLGYLPYRAGFTNRLKLRRSLWLGSGFGDKELREATR